MKFKITYNPQNIKSATKKFISSSLILGLLFNSIPPSFANVLSEDRRYETFEGNNIIIDNVLEEDVVDVEIEGNTLVNLIEDNSRNVRLNSKVYSTNADGSTYSFFMNKANLKFPLKSSTEYTIAFKVTENIYDHIPISTIVLGQGDKDTGHGLDTWSNRLYWNKDFNMEEEKPGLGFYQKTFVTSTRIEETSFLWIGFIGQGANNFNTLIEDIMIVEGKYDLNNYFKGIESVGQDDKNSHGIEILSNNQNLIEEEYLHTITVLGNNNEILLEPTTKRNTYILKNRNYKNLTVSSKYGANVTYADVNNIMIDTTLTGFLKTRVLNVPSNSCYIYITAIQRGENNEEDIVDITEELDVMVNLGETKIDYIQYKTNKISILLNEPLRGLPSGVKDRIIKRNGQWVVERNTKEMLLNGSESWQCFNDTSVNMGGDISYACLKINDIEFDHNTINIISDMFNGEKGNNYNYRKEMIYSWDRDETEVVDSRIYIHVKNTKLKEISLNGYKECLKENPIKIVYALQTPKYEPLNIDLTLNTYIDTTYIYNNAVIPANMKVAVDRVANRAVEAIQLTQENPTVHNISQARMWVNLMKESSNKDILSNQLDSITEIKDLNIEKETTTANVDVYIKSKNGLSMTLSTNSIIFDEFSGTEDMEKLNAVEVTVDSSLPYRLNTYLLSEIKNENSSKIIPKELFNIKLNGETDYKAFNNINEKLVLKEDCSKGQNRYGIDLILKGSLTHEADIYKTIIKFEAEQK